MSKEDAGTGGPRSVCGSRRPLTSADAFLGKYTVCGAPANEVDHIRPTGDDHDYSNLRAICRACHAAKSAAEGAAARIVRPRLRAPEPRPGIIDIDDHAPRGDRRWVGGAPLRLGSETGAKLLSVRAVKV
jgi:hypothetical protein